MSRRLIFCVASCLILIPPLVGAQSQQLPDSRVAALLGQADKAKLELNLDEAHARVDESIALAESIADRVGLAMAYRMKGTVFNKAGRSRDASAFHARALAAFEALGDKTGVASALTGLTVAAVTLGETAKARDFGNRGLRLLEELHDDRGRAYLLGILVQGDDVPAGDARLDEMQAIADRLGDDELRAEVFKFRATAQFRAGDYSAARLSYESAIAALEKTPDVVTLAATHLSLGRVFRAHGDYEGALARYQKAIELLAPTKERYTIVEATNASAIALGALNRPSEALALYERGLALAHESGNPRLVDFMEGNLAGGLIAAREYARAIPALEAVIAKKPELSIAGYRYAALALALTHVGRAAEALAPANEGVRIARELKQVENLSIRLDNRAWTLSVLGRFEDALADAQEAIAIVEKIRTTLVPSDFLKRGFGERVQKGYARTVSVLSQLGRGTEALELAEQGRARAFLDLLAARESGPEVPTRGDAKPVDAARSGLASESAGQPLDIAGIRDVAARLHSTLVAYWVSDDATQIWIVPPGGAPSHTRVPITRDKLKTLVAATTAPLRQSDAPATTRGDDAGVTASQAADDDLTALPMRGLGLLALSRDDKAAWRQLHQTLIEPVLAQLPARGGRLTIVPHGPLFQLSFAALRDRRGRYLLEDYELHYAPAISALDFTGRRQQLVNAGTPGPWALVGDPASLPVVGKQPLAALPGAARELAAIAALAPRGKVVRLSGARAGEASLARALGAERPSVVHFATHGFAFDDPKMPPFLALNLTGAAGADDGRLTLDEVYGLALTSDLVVLSACRSGAGQVTSDGIMSLTRGFFYAGSPSVMATFWDVTDEATAILMRGFYRSYARDRGKSASLRAAQLALLADLRAGKVVVTASGRRVTLPEHPLLWAGFFLSGEP